MLFAPGARRRLVYTRPAPTGSNGSLTPSKPQSRSPIINTLCGPGAAARTGCHKAPSVTDAIRTPSSACAMRLWPFERVNERLVSLDNESVHCFGILRLILTLVHRPGGD